MEYERQYLRHISEAAMSVTKQSHPAPELAPFCPDNECRSRLRNSSLQQCDTILSYDLEDPVMCHGYVRLRAVPVHRWVSELHSRTVLSLNLKLITPTRALNVSH